MVVWPNTKFIWQLVCNDFPNNICYSAVLAIILVSIDVDLLIVCYDVKVVD